MSLPLNDIQRAVFDVLSAGLPGVFVTDSDGPNMPFPYVICAQFSALRNDLLDALGSDVAVGLDAYSIQDGNQEVQGILETIYNLLHRKAFALPETQWVTTMFEYANVLREPDGRTRHGVIRFIVMTFDAPIGRRAEAGRTLDDIGSTYRPASGRRSGRTLDE